MPKLEPKSELIEGRDKVTSILAQEAIFARKSRRAPRFTTATELAQCAYRILERMPDHTSRATKDKPWETLRQDLCKGTLTLQKRQAVAEAVGFDPQHPSWFGGTLQDFNAYLATLPDPVASTNPRPLRLDDTPDNPVDDLASVRLELSQAPGTLTEGDSRQLLVTLRCHISRRLDRLGLRAVHLRLCGEGLRLTECCEEFDGHHFRDTGHPILPDQPTGHGGDPHRPFWELARDSGVLRCVLEAVLCTLEGLGDGSTVEATISTYPKELDVDEDLPDLAKTDGSEPAPVALQRVMARLSALTLETREDGLIPLGHHKLAFRAEDGVRRDD
ncbi:MAG: hypothetical protein AAGI34_14170 [Pseudomonadota bacterium]